MYTVPVIQLLGRLFCCISQVIRHANRTLIVRQTCAKMSGPIITTHIHDDTGHLDDWKVGVAGRGWTLRVNQRGWGVDVVLTGIVTHT